MNEMSVGDTGVLQKLDPGTEDSNGLPAKIIDEFKKGGIVVTVIVGGSVQKLVLDYDGWVVKTYVGENMAIQFHQIRPVNDPGDQNEIVRDEELVV